MEYKKKVWIFTFEYAGVAKVGGLGEVPANQAKHLSDQFEISVFLPSHGQINKLKSKYEWEKLPISCVGQINPYFFGEMGPETSYNIVFYKFKMGNNDIILLSGENSFTSKFLDDKTVYNPETIKGKICFYSLGIRCLVDYLIDNNKEYLPNIVHLHDYHSVIPFIGMKQELMENSLDVSSIITIHLLTWPRFDLDFYKLCGINESPISILLEEGLKNFTLREIFDLSETVKLTESGENPPTVEKIGAIVSDLVTTVSQSYLISDIIPNCGQELIGFKADFIWDGCDWDYDEIYNKVVNNLGEEIYKVLGFPSDAQINRSDMKKYLLTYKIGHLNQSPLINSQKVLETINEISNGNPFIRNGNVKAFSESGPSILTTGRISPQKGFETIFESVPEVIKVVPNAKFIFLILPTDYSLNEIKTYAHFVKQYPKNIRIIFGVAADIFYLAHIAADVYCALSRWEPFGIMALEAMASKIPIIATKIGGLQESIVDVRLYPEIGTGILIEKNKPNQFTEALISLFKAAEVSERIKGTQNHTHYKTETLNIINQIPDEIIKSRVLIDPNYYLKIRENCFKRVKNNFTWKIVTKKLIDLYSKVQGLL